MWADNETSEDLLGFKVHADLLIDVIKDDKVLPVTVGVFGDWGSGKSSILKIIDEELRKLDDGTFVLYFNGWVFEGYDDAKAALLESILKAFEENKTFGNEIKDHAKKLLKSVNWMRVLGLGFKKIVVPAATAYFTGGASLIPFLAQEFSKSSPAELAQQLTGEGAEEYLQGLVKKQDEEEPMLVRQFKDDFKKLIEKSKIKKLVVIIDDLDRCTPDRIIENLEAIKLFLNVERTAFVIGADPRIVRHAIDYRYKTANKIDSENERIVDDYLEKLIQIPYNLPRLSESEVETYISLLVCKRELPEVDSAKVIPAFHAFRIKDRYSVYGLAAIKDCIPKESHALLAKSLISIPALVPIITQTLDGNPRRVKRFLNTLTLRQRLASVAKLSEFNDAILAKLMVLEYSELPLFTQLFNWQSAQKGTPKEIMQLEEIAKSGDSLVEMRGEIEKLDSAQKWSKERVINWLKLEPYLSDIDLSDYFWLSRDKVASTITSASLIPPIVRTLYSKINVDSLTASVSKKIIKEEIRPLSDYERSSFLEFSQQMLIKNPKTKRGYDIFHLLMEENYPEAEKYYVKGLKSVNVNDIPPAIGEAIKRFESVPVVKEFLDTTLSQSKSGAGRALKTK